VAELVGNDGDAGRNVPPTRPNCYSRKTVLNVVCAHRHIARRADPSPRGVVEPRQPRQAGVQIALVRPHALLERRPCESCIRLFQWLCCATAAGSLFKNCLGLNTC
jgi:hypothetical protein